LADEIQRRLALAQRLVKERRFEEAADVFLELLPARATDVGQLGPGCRQAALHAGICYAKAGRTRMAVALFAALGERERAAAVLKNAGRRADADRVMRGHPAPDSPWPPGVIHSRPGQREAEGSMGSTGSLQGDPFALAERYARTDRAPKAIEALMEVESSHRRYAEAVARVVRLANHHGIVSYPLERFTNPFVKQDPARHLPAHVPTLYLLGALFDKAGMRDAAARAFRATVAADPEYRDAGTRLAVLIETRQGIDADFARVLEDDLAFAALDMEASRPPGSAPGRREPVSLPSLPDLPRVSAPAPLPGRPGPPAPVGGLSRPERLPRPEAPEFVPPESSDADETLSGEWLDRVRLPSRSEELGLGPVQIGDVIARRYRIQSELGVGGMAVVYRVTDLELEEEVALKLFARSSGDEAAVARFKQEMRIARRLSHPHIVRTYEFGTWKGAYFLTMELLEGRDLDQLIADCGGKLPVGQAIRLFAQAFEGLGAAHELGVVHRDVKPANMFVVDGGRTLKIMDFGIAKFQGATSGHTATGAVVGTPAFISPERLRGIEDGGPSADLYAMGVVMYRALTGVLPFNGTDVAQLFMQILEKDPAPPSMLDPDLSSKIDEVVLRLVAKKPGARYANCAEARKAVLAAWDDMKRMNISL
jgi:tetratricopeptide (TPR) repeat protein